MRLLHVEDESALAALVRRVLAIDWPELEYELAGTLQEGLAAIRREEKDRPEILLVDLRLPDGNGMRLLQEVRHTGLPMAVVILSGTGDESSAVGALKAGADEYLTKKSGFEKHLAAILRHTWDAFQARRHAGPSVLHVLCAGLSDEDAARLQLQLERQPPHLRIEAVHDGRALERRLTDGGRPLPDALLLAHPLSDGSAIERIRRFEEEGFDGLPPAVLLADAGDTETAVEAMQAGFRDYIVRSGAYIERLPAALENAIHHGRWGREQSRREEADRRYHALVFNNLAPILLVDPANGAIVDANPAALNFYGYASDDIRGRTLFDLSLQPPDQVRDRMRHAGDRTGCFFETRHRRADGTLCDVAVYSGVMKLGDRTLLYEILHDITERKQAEEERDLVFRHSIDFLCIATFDGFFRQVNPAMTSALGWSAGEFLSRPFLEFVHPDDRLRTQQAMRDLAEGRSVTGFENRYEDRTGALHWISWNSHPLPEKGLVFAVGRDVTAARRTEESRRLLSTAVEQAAESVVITDRDGTIQYVNPAFERVTGYRRDEIIGRNPNTLKSGRQDEMFYKKMWDTILSGETWTGQIVNRRKDGSIYQERAAISPMRDAAGNISNFVAVKADISAEVRLHEQLLHAQKMEAIGRLAGGIAHDFNNLLMIIINSALFIEPVVPPDAAERTDLQALTEAAHRAAELTRQLLIFSRQQPLAPRRIDLNETVQGLSKMLKRLLGENIELVVTLDPGLPAVKADPMQIEQAVVNLAVNARDAMPQGGRLEIRTARANFPLEDTASFIEKPDAAAGVYAAVTVRDTGIGIPDAIRYRIFEPFFTTKGVGKGTGLGLATTFSSVKQHGGFLSLQTEVGYGSTFTLYLPALESPAGAADFKTVARLRRGTETILLVEDEEMVRRTEARILTSLGYRVIEAANAHEALAEMSRASDQVRLLITDVVMPDLGGPALAAEIRRIQPGLPVLLVSGYPVAQLTEEGHLRGDEEFLGKPFTSEDVSAALRRMLDGK